MTLFFYETSNTFFNEENKPIIYKDALGNKLPPNLFTKDPYICLGYDLEGFKQEEAILYTMNSKGYKFEGNPETNENKILNKKTVRLRWLHEFDNGDIHPAAAGVQHRTAEPRARTEPGSFRPRPSEQSHPV
jgi:hypothetical protein